MANFFKPRTGIFWHGCFEEENLILESVMREHHE